MTEPSIANVNLIVIFNSTLKPKTSGEIWQDQPFKQKQLEKVFKLEKIKQQFRTFEFDVND